MKKIILIIAALSLATGAFAQNVQWGAKAGLNVASEVIGSLESDPRLGAYAGVFAEIPLARWVDLSPELLYSMQGAESTSSTDKRDYLALPVMFKFYVMRHRLSIDVGPQFGYLLSAKITANQAITIDDRTIIDDGETMSYYSDDGIKKFDTSLGLGVSWKFARRFDVGLRYYWGLTNLREDLDSSNRLLQVGLGYRF